MLQGVCALTVHYGNGEPKFLKKIRRAAVIKEKRGKELKHVPLEMTGSVVGLHRTEVHAARLGQRFA